MNNRTLVLNHSYQALSVIPWYRAISLLYEKRAETLMRWDRDKNNFVYCEYDSTVSNYDKTFVYKIPSIIRLLRPSDGLPLILKKYKPKFSKINVFYRDNFECQYCFYKISSDSTQRKSSNENILTIDHILPVSRGGKTTFENCVCACANCNRIKSNKTLEETNFRLKKKPVQPSYEILIKRKMAKKQFPDEWKYYIKY